jgi:hypothetical protein
MEQPAVWAPLSLGAPQRPAPAGTAPQAASFGHEEERSHVVEQNPLGVSAPTQIPPAHWASLEHGAPTAPCGIARRRTQTPAPHS